MFIINAEIRREQGKGANRCPHVADKFPTIIYGGAKAPIATELDHDVIINMQTKTGFYNEVLTIVADGKEARVRTQAVQCHPLKPKLSHIGFVRA